MPAWWDSPETLGALTTWLRIAIVAFGVLTAAATGLTILTGNRLAILQQEDREKLVARLGEAEKRTEEAEKRAAEGEKRTEPRTLSARQAEILTAAFGPLSGTRLVVVQLTDDGEAYRFAEQLIKAILASGTNVGLEMI